MFKYLTLLVISAAFLTSCSKNNPAGPGASTWIQPNAGSSFTFDEYATDTTSGQPVPGSRDTSVQTFLQTGMSYMGKTNVAKLVSVTRTSNDTTYLNFESNGDVSAFSQFSANTGIWFTVPSGSKTSNSIVVADTTVTYGGVSTKTKITLTTAYVDDETLTVKGQSVSVTKLQQSTVTTQTVTPPGTTSTTTDISFAYFAPSLGYVAKEETPISTNTSTGKKRQGHLSILFDYTEK